MTTTRPNLPELRRALEAYYDAYNLLRKHSMGNVRQAGRTTASDTINTFHINAPENIGLLLAYIEHLESLCGRAAGECQRLRMNCLSVGVIPLNGMQFDSIIDELRAVARATKGEQE